MSHELEIFCEQNGIEAEFREAPGAETAEGAAEALNTTPEHIIKSLVFFADGEPVLVIVRGSDHVSESKVSEVLRAGKCRLAEPEEVEKETGFSVGGVPPVGAGLPKLVDSKVLEMDKVYGGGGKSDRIIALDPRFIIREDDLVEDVTV
ncbi:MAG: YbaK/EbsC family protein [Candidatus Nanohaloarchaeota archaeon QJJ-7]|nr:YbaK/EbsC family protein [Candidatus Nanohaloarchaeota archaeon QJJ-7]